jgi:phospholipid transport system substrate-binding protein
MRRNRHRQIITLTILTTVGSLGFGGDDALAALAQSPLDVVKARNQAVAAIIAKAGDDVNDETRERLKEIINSVIDFEELSRRSLGTHWEERTEQEKRAFVGIFSQLIKNSSVKKLEIYQADRMVYEEPEINGSQAKVTTIAYRKRKRVEIVYAMHNVDSQWRVYDMEIDGVSTARNYRDSFNKEIAKSSYKDMYDKLVKRLEEERTPA